MKKHVPVLLNEVINQFKNIESESVNIIDCTLGQAGHSWEIYSNLKKGVLLSIDLNKSSIEWVAKNYELTLSEDQLTKSKLRAERVDDEKKWIIIEGDFSNLKEILEKEGLNKVDFILADLGFSNFELNQNIGISFSNSNQDLNMNYSGTGIFAKDILNGFNENELKEVFAKYFDKISLKVSIGRIKSFRGRTKFAKIGDLQKAFGGLPNSYLIKATQALRSFVNQEELKLKSLCESMQDLISDNGLALVITFNPLEEEIVENVFVKHQIVEPNIEEIIKNPQSRSAKLYVYKKTTNTSTPKERWT